MTPERDDQAAADLRAVDMFCNGNTDLADAVLRASEELEDGDDRLPHGVLNMCYTEEVSWPDDNPRVSVRELRINTSAVLRRVEAGEQLVLTVDGRPVADLIPRPFRATWVPKARAIKNLVQADPGLRDDLKAAQTETTDDVVAKLDRLYGDDQ